MAFQVSPGINVTERDLTVGVENVSLSTGGFVGPFQWGPALQVQNVASEVDLVNQFGEPDANNFQHWFSAAAFLSYSNNLKVVRAISDNALNATSEEKSTTGTGMANTSTTAITGTGTLFQTELVVGQTINLSTGETATVATITDNTHLTVSAALSGAVSGANTYTTRGVLIKNDTHHDASFEDGATGYGAVAAKWPGDLGNSLKISICPSAAAFQANATGSLVTTASSTTVTGSGTLFQTELVVGDYITIDSKRYQVKSIASNTSMTMEKAVTVANTWTTTNWQRQWEYWSSFDGPPGTSAYGTDHGATTDEMHVVVADEDGKFDGLVDNAVEKYAYVSKASDGRSPNGDNNYYKNVLNRQSEYVWWLSHVGTTTNWGSPALGLTFGSKSLPYTQSLQGGNDDNENVTVGQQETGWDLFIDADSTDVSLLISGPATPATLGTYIVDQIAAVRKDAVAFLSPLKASVVNNIGSENASVTTDRNNLPSSSYAVMDSGWKYLYDKYNDVYRWVPLNGDVAGLAARTDQTNAAWFSPAGFTRGHIKNVVKLAWTPKQTDRDDLYKIGVNSVVNFPGQGVLLYGDKTLLNRPSAFDRINVRRLFIAMEKTISQYAKDNLFEFNDEHTRASFRAVVEPFLRTIKARRGITDFLVVCDASNNTADVVDRNEFVGHIFVKPNRSINYIQLNFVAVRSGVSFQEVVGAAG